MKKFLILLSAVCFSLATQAQVFSGSQDIDKGKREGAYVLSNLDEKFVDKVWKQYLTGLGTPLASKDTYIIKNGKLEGVGTEGITFYSKVAKNKDRSLVFLSAVLPDGTIITNGNEKWDALGKYLSNFQEVLSLHDAARQAENNYNDASENHKKVVKNGDKLKDKVEDNKKEKEKLLKKIEENKQELEKLLTDIENNKKDQAKAIEEIAAKKVLVDEAKKKLNGQ